MNYYNRHLGDYSKKTGHLTMLEHGALNRLLDLYYTREAPIPDDQVLRLVCARTPAEITAVKAVLEEFFQRDGSLWRNRRAEDEIARFREKSAKSKKSAEARWQAHSLSNGASANAMRSHSEGSADGLHSQTDRIASQEPGASPNLQCPPAPRKRRDAKRFDEFWGTWPKSERKQDKAKSADYWALHDLDTQADAILADVRTKRGTQKWQDGFIEAPLVYLRGKRWEDGVTPDEPRQPNGRAEPSGRAMVPDAEQSAAEMDALYGTPPASKAVVDAAIAKIASAKLARSTT